MAIELPRRMQKRRRRGWPTRKIPVSAKIDQSLAPGKYAPGREVGGLSAFLGGLFIATRRHGDIGLLMRVVSLSIAAEFFSILARLPSDAQLHRDRDGLRLEAGLCGPGRRRPARTRPKCTPAVARLRFRAGSRGPAQRKPSWKSCWRRPPEEDVLSKSHPPRRTTNGDEAPLRWTSRPSSLFAAKRKAYRQESLTKSVPAIPLEL